MWWHLHIFLKCHNIEPIYFRFFSYFEITWFPFEITFMFKNLEISSNTNNWEYGNFKNFEPLKVKHYEEKARDKSVLKQK